MIVLSILVVAVLGFPAVALLIPSGDGTEPERDTGLKQLRGSK